MKRLKMAGSFVRMMMMMMMVILGLQLQVEIARAQIQTQPSNGTTIPDAEVHALNTILGKWGFVEYVNRLREEPCTEFNTSLAVKCECNETVCHITRLKVYALEVHGQIPDELWSLTYLKDLDLGINYLKGPVSPSVGNLIQMQSLKLDHNSFSGELPKELGKLTELTVLAFSTNNFSGPLPLELGNLVKLGLLLIPAELALALDAEAMHLLGDVDIPRTKESKAGDLSS